MNKKLALASSLFNFQLRNIKTYFKLFFVILSLQLLLSNCSAVKWAAGANIDAEEFEKARVAKMYEERFKAAKKLSERMEKNDPIDNADLTFYLSPNLLKMLLKQYENSTGWLDQATNYTIKSLDLNLHYGSAIVTASLDAKNSKYGVVVKLNLDLIMTVEIDSNKLYIRLEPFNISPAVSAGGILSATEEIIQNLIKINLADIGKQLPISQIPVDFNNKFQMQDTKMTIKDKINMNIYSPARSIEYKLKLKEILIFESAVFVALNEDKVTVN